ncbi:MAG: Obg family GTPase CgtA, partial [Planctomycetota bacterium]
AQIATLLDISRCYLNEAEKGQPGMGKNRTGRNGEDCLIRLPLGTLVRNRRTGELLHDLDKDGEEVIVARGGKGGRGNRSFATATHRAPREFESGVPSVELELALELKLMAEVGLLGLPNAGKSTLLSRISAARPRIADYPFTTLAPQIGIVELDEERRIVVADIPGLIEGAHEGVGLGIEFLRHLERTAVLIHLIDPGDGDLQLLVDNFHVIRNELCSYSAELAARPILTVLNKMDLLLPEQRQQLASSLSQAIGTPVSTMSGVTREGVPELLEKIWRLLHPVPCS